MTFELLFSTVGILPSIQTFRFGGFPRSAYSVLLRFRRSRNHEAPGNAESGLANSINPPSAPELLLSKKLHGPAKQLLRLVTPPPLDVQLQVLLQDQDEPSFHQDRDHDRHRPHLCSFGSITPTIQPLDFSVHVISHTGPYPRSSKCRHDQRLFGHL